MKIHPHNPIPFMVTVVDRGESTVFMRYLPTVNGPMCLVDDEDFELWHDFSWGTSSGGYPAAYFQLKPGQTQLIRLHRLIARPRQGQFVHHVNKRVFDSRRENLRCVTAKEHAALHPDVESLQITAERGLTSWHLFHLWRIEDKIRARNDERRR